jgi:hypothetical protein
MFMLRCAVLPNDTVAQSSAVPSAASSAPASAHGQMRQKRTGWTIAAVMVWTAGVQPHGPAGVRTLPTIRQRAGGVHVTNIRSVGSEGADCIQQEECCRCAVVRQCAAGCKRCGARRQPFWTMLPCYLDRGNAHVDVQLVEASQRLLSSTIAVPGAPRAHVCNTVRPAISVRILRSSDSTKPLCPVLYPSYPPICRSKLTCIIDRLPPAKQPYSSGHAT